MSAIGAPANGRRVLRLAALVVIAAVCLSAAVALIGSAIQTLHSSVAGAGVDTDAGSGGAAARREAITSAVTMGALAVLVAALTEIVLPRPLGLLRGVGNRRFVGGTLGATAGYIALLLLTGVFASTVAAGRAYPGSAVTDPTLLGRDLVESGAAGLAEELLLFAIPLALLGIWKSPRARWLGLALIVALRLGIHLYYGIGYAAIRVVPWLIGAWLLYRAIGSIWPLIIGHTLYDAALLTTMRTDHTWPYTALQIATAIGTIPLATTVARTANRTGRIRWLAVRGDDDQRGLHRVRPLSSGRRHRASAPNGMRRTSRP